MEKINTKTLSDEERERRRLQDKAIARLRKLFPVKGTGQTQKRVFTKRDMREMALRAINITGFPKREGLLKYYQGLLPGEHIRVRGSYDGYYWLDN